METKQARPSVSVSLLLLAGFTFCGTMGMHIFVPALPLAALDLGSSISSIQLTISLYILGLAFGQLLYGPISDRIGRRPALFGGLCLFTAASLFAAVATSTTALVIARLLQALGGAAGIVVPRAIVRDTNEPAEAARKLALMNLIVTVGPAVAPLIGVGMIHFLGWRSILFALFGFSAVAALLAWKALPETFPGPRKRQEPSEPGGYFELLRSGSFMAYTIGGGFATTSLYAVISTSPFIFGEQLGRSEEEVGLYLTLLISGIWLGGLLTMRLARRADLGPILIRSNLLSLFSALAFLFVVLLDALSIGATLACMFLFAVGVGAAGPVSLAQAVAQRPHIAGAASGVYGFSQMMVGGFCAFCAGLFSNPAMGVAVVLFAAGMIAQASFWLAQRAESGEAGS